MLPPQAVIDFPDRLIGIPIVPLLDKPLLRVSDKAATLRLRDGVQLSDGILHNLPCLPVTDNRHDFFQPRKGSFLRTGGVLINHKA